ncbi:MAG: hypothetical protein ACJ76H_07610 [Bacteriovoracaceae bacterium]
MKVVVLLSLIAVCFSCGGMILDKDKVTVRKSPVSVVAEDLKDKELFLRVLEEKYKAEKNTLCEAIVHDMLTELHQKYPNRSPASVTADLENLRKDPRFLALELTVEHLAQRESFKLTAL